MVRAGGTGGVPGREAIATQNFGTIPPTDLQTFLRPKTEVGDYIEFCPELHVPVALCDISGKKLLQIFVLSSSGLLFRP